MMTTRIYLTYQDSANVLQKWGGIHITLVGQHDNNENPARLSYLREHQAISIVNNGRNYWTAHSETCFTLRPTKYGFIAYFKSYTLDRIAEKLEDLGFRNIKGPRHTGIDWHITLNGYSQSQAKAFCEMLCDRTRRPKWYLTIATKHMDGTNTWEQLKY